MIFFVLKHAIKHEYNDFKCWMRFQFVPYTCMYDISNIHVVFLRYHNGQSFLSLSLFQIEVDYISSTWTNIRTIWIFFQIFVMCQCIPFHNEVKLHSRENNAIDKLSWHIIWYIRLNFSKWHFLNYFCWVSLQYLICMKILATEYIK